MNYNYETTQVILEGADLLYNMLRDITESISHLPGCGMTANLKRVAANIGTASEGVYRTIKNIAADMDEPCGNCIYDADEYCESDIPTSSDLREFLELIDSLLTSGKPILISADIYINGATRENAVDNSVAVESEV